MNTKLIIIFSNNFDRIIQEEVNIIYTQKV